MKKSATALLVMFMTVRLFGEMEIIRFTDYMQYIKENLPELKSNMLEDDIARSKFVQAKGNSDLNLFGGSSYNYDEPAGSQTIEKSDSFTNFAGVSKTINETGTRLSTQYRHSSSSVTAQPQNYETYQPSISFTVRQPVMKNFFGTLDRYPVKNSKLDYEISKLKQNITEKSLSYTYSLLYFEWCAYDRLYDLGKRNVKNSYSQYQQTLRKRKSRLAENDDVQKAYSSYLSYRIANTVNETNYIQAMNQIQNVLKISEIKPDLDEFEDRYKMARDFSYQIVVFEETTQYKTLQKTLDQLKLSRNAADNSLLPQLDILASYERKDSRDTFAESIASFDKSEYSLGFEVNYPFENREAKGSLEENTLLLQQLSYQLQADRNTYNSDISHTVKTIEKLIESIELHSLNLRALRSQLATENQKYDQARLSLSTLILTRNKIASEEASLVREKLELISLHNTYLQLIN
jgi:outer membrane protein